MSSKLQKSAMACFIGIVGAQTAVASYEKASFISSKNLSLAGAVNSSIGGGESLFYNPAGLAMAQDKNLDLSFTVSPYAFTYTAPMTSKNERTSTKILPVPSVFANYKVSPKLGVGLGIYPSAGAAADKS
jgi:long-subunit fatty acid transport protein